MDSKKVLIVDDDRVIVRSLSMILTAAGYNPVVARDGGEAISSVRRDRPDLILLDINFPPDVGHGGGVAWNGFLIMGWLRRMDEAKDIPILLITGDLGAQRKEQAIAAGAVGLLHKPVSKDELLVTIRHALGEVAPEAQPTT
jgi:two-component system KDP operon response regulator KdpE